MTILLNPELQQYLEAQIRAGKFTSADAVIAEALRQMKEREEKLEWLRREIQVGIDQLDRGEGEPLDIDEMVAELSKKHGHR